jgi:hypothetical protein
MLSGMQLRTARRIALWITALLSLAIAGCPWRLAQPDHCNPQPGHNVACLSGVPYVCGEDLRWHPLQPQCSTLSPESVCCRVTSPRTGNVITSCVSESACLERGGVVETTTPDVALPDAAQ